MAKEIHFNGKKIYRIFCTAKRIIYLIEIKRRYAFEVLIRLLNFMIRIKYIYVTFSIVFNVWFIKSKCKLKIYFFRNYLKNPK